MFKGKKSKSIIGLLLVIILIASNLISPLQNAFAADSQGVAVTRGGYYDLPDTVDNYL